ncbi:MAG: phosphoglycerate kinase [Nocardioidaceae bacterium]
MLLPTDITVAPQFSADAPASVVAASQIPADQMGLDVGPDSAVAFAEAIRSARRSFGMALWGSEFPSFAAGTKQVAQALTEVSDSR